MGFRPGPPPLKLQACGLLRGALVSKPPNPKPPNHDPPNPPPPRPYAPQPLPPHTPQTYLSRDAQHIFNCDWDSNTPDVRCVRVGMVGEGLGFGFFGV